MNSFAQILEPLLAQENISLERFRELLARLLDFGVICRAESLTEQQYYDQFVRVEDIVAEYLEILGLRLQHDTHFEFVRVVPPGARVPGMEDDGEQPWNGGYRARLSQSEVALVLALRAEYDKALREGQIDDSGCVALSLEALTIAFHNLLKRKLPENLTERRSLFRRLRQLRLISFQSEEELENGEAWLRIRPMIVSFVNDDVLAVLRQETDGADAMVAEDSLPGGPDEGNSDKDKQHERVSEAASLFAVE